MLRTVFTLISLALATAGWAQDRPRAILVLDASGSMWGQIDGINKIVIARDVIGTLLPTLSADQELGLTVYGHRRKGDCSDIETVVQPGLNQVDVIADAVNAINPKGKTPLSAAVIAAAEALRYTEERATVILVSDGRETCDFDPCAVGRELEALGVDFTAHVIGFDVANPADRAQLQCLAEETGGTFRTASNASELTDALAIVAEPPAPPAPDPFDVTFNAKDGPGGPPITSGLDWVVSGPDGPLLQGGDDMTPTLQLLPGDYSAAVTRQVDGAMVERTFTVDGHQTVLLILPELPPEPVRVRVFATDGPSGPRINDDLVWDVTSGGETVLDTELSPNLDLDLVKGEYLVSVMRPADEAFVEERFGVGTVNKTVTLTLPEYRPAATLEAPATAVAGAQIDMRWTGPDARNDFISVAETGAKGSSWIEYTYTREGPLLQLLMPPEPGEYEIRYVLNDGRKVLASQPISVTAVTAQITPPDSLPAGATVPVDWTGPDYRNDYIAVVAPGDDGWINYTYTREGAPLNLELPGEPGAYEIIYTMNQDRTVLARVPITVTGVDFALSAPDSAPGGSEVTVDWTGPDYRNDYIAITEVGAEDNSWINYTYTREGSPLALPVPLAAGDYEIRYVLAQDRTVMAREPITITAVTGTVSGPETAVAGSEIAVDWTGPGYHADFVTIADAEADPKSYEAYTYTREGAPLMLQMPVEPGDYQLRYVASGRDAQVLARQPITVTPVTATLQADATTAPGSNLVVDWTGPDYRNDYIAISVPGDNGYEVYTYTREGTPLIIEAPETPGTYELRYVMRQDSTVLATAPLTVE